MHCICKCIKGSGKPTTTKKKMAKREKYKFIKAHLANKAKVTTTKQMAHSVEWHLFTFSFTFFLFFFSYREKVLFAVSSVVVVAVVVVVSAFGVSLLLLPLFDTAMKRNAHAKEVAN